MTFLEHIPFTAAFFPEGREPWELLRDGRPTAEDPAAAAAAREGGGQGLGGDGDGQAGAAETAVALAVGSAT